MLEELIASCKNTSDHRLISTTFGSAAFHGVVLAVALWLPGEPPVKHATPVTTDTTLIYVPRSRPNTPRAEPNQADVTARVSAPLDETPILHHPVVAPTSIPPIDLYDSFDVDEFKRFAAQGTASVGVTNLGGDRTSSSSGIFRMLDLDVRPERLAGPSPRYPEMLRRVAISGRVELEFVVDTTGRVEANSVQVLSSTHVAFEAPALTAVLRAVYRPGEVAGNRVRVLVRQVVAFNMK